MDLGLLQREVAVQVGVDEITVYNWEKQRTVPEIRYVPQIIAFLGYCPLIKVSSLADRLITYRTMLGLSQRELAKILTVDQSTLASWETGKHRPTGQSRTIIETFLVELTKME